MSATAVAHAAHVGSASRAVGSGVKYARQQPRRSDTTWNSFCVTCAHWHFGQYLENCSRCRYPIFWWVRDSELRLFERFSHRGGF